MSDLPTSEPVPWNINARAWLKFRVSSIARRPSGRYRPNITSSLSARSQGEGACGPL